MKICQSILKNSQRHRILPPLRLSWPSRSQSLDGITKPLKAPQSQCHSSPADTFWRLPQRSFSSKCVCVLATDHFSNANKLTEQRGHQTLGKILHLISMTTHWRHDNTRVRTEVCLLLKVLTYAIIRPTWWSHERETPSNGPTSVRTRVLSWTRSASRALFWESSHLIFIHGCCKTYSRLCML